jgi:hypothetical protein
MATDDVGDLPDRGRRVVEPELTANGRARAIEPPAKPSRRLLNWGPPVQTTTNDPSSRTEASGLYWDPGV